MDQGWRRDSISCQRSIWKPAGAQPVNPACPNQIFLSSYLQKSSNLRPGRLSAAPNADSQPPFPTILWSTIWTSIQSRCTIAPSANFHLRPPSMSWFISAKLTTRMKKWSLESQNKLCSLQSFENQKLKYKVCVSSAIIQTNLFKYFYLVVCESHKNEIKIVLLRWSILHFFFFVSQKIKILSYAFH